MRAEFLESISRDQPGDAARPRRKVKAPAHPLYFATGTQVALAEPFLGRPLVKGIKMESTAIADNARGVCQPMLDHARCVGTAVACDLIGCSIKTLHKLIATGEIESFVDGNRRKVTVRSIVRRRDRLLAEGRQSPSRPRRGRPRKAETTST